MMYPFLTLDDNTEIVHSEIHQDGTLKVYIEKPDAKDCFHHATCYLPGYRWEDIFGFSNDQIAKYQEIIESTAHLILQFAQEGGYANAAGLRKILLNPVFFSFFLCCFSGRIILGFTANS